MEKHPAPDAVNPVSIIAGYARLGESLRAAGNFREVAMEIAKIAELAETTVMEETSDWFDGHTVKRNMSELKKHAGQFSKIAEELDMMQQRASALYDDMGNVLGRYFEMAQIEPVSSAIQDPEDKGAEGFSPEDRAPEFDGAGGNPADDAGREQHDAQDGDLDDSAPLEPGATHTTDIHPGLDPGDSDEDDDMLEGIVDRIMEKIVPESSSAEENPAQAIKSLNTPKSYARSQSGFSHDQAKEILRRTGATTTEDAEATMAAADRIREGGKGSGPQKGQRQTYDRTTGKRRDLGDSGKQYKPSRAGQWDVTPNVPRNAGGYPLERDGRIDQNQVSKDRVAYNKAARYADSKAGKAAGASYPDHPYHHMQRSGRKKYR